MAAVLEHTSHEERLRFMNFNYADGEALRALLPSVRESIESILHSFYQHVDPILSFLQNSMDKREWLEPVKHRSNTG